MLSVRFRTNNPNPGVRAHFYGNLTLRILAPRPNILPFAHSTIRYAFHSIPFHFVWVLRMRKEKKRYEAVTEKPATATKWVVTCMVGGVIVGVSLLGAYSSQLWKSRRRNKKPVRVYMDGCFDMMHYGHCNALRQARALGDQLIVGVVSDAEIIANKGPPVTPLHERLIMVNAVKWVDEVIPEAPYAITEEFMKKLFDEYKIDYIIHGDDPCVLPDGTDAYAHAKKAGRYKQIKRTEGVSSTDIVGRMLLCVRERSITEKNHNHSSLQRQFSNGHSPKFEAGASAATASGTRISHFCLHLGPGPDSRIVYIDGAFDLFHAGHVEILRLARDLGDFLLVGIHTDQTVSATRGSHRPIMNLHERSLSVLACRYVDEVIIGAPWEISKDMLTTFNISLVVHGTIAESNDFQKEECNPYAVPISMGIFKVLESPLDITTTTIIRRIVSNHEAYQNRNKKKGESEKRYYEGKSHVSEE
ncbi:Ethanolamine-phosphate cytidylyltransferase [Glycine max]|nr:Ethanolamine-phosphate cytidylyltransferase [Glycine max]